MATMVDLRSDRLTQPTGAMRDAIANAEVGDEQKREDPTVNELERRGAEFLGQEESVFVPTATMANQIALKFDTVTLCFSKGLGCPLGALIAGRAQLMQHARRAKHKFGGAMRQAGIVAAACLYALDNHVDRIAEDHARARRLGEGLAGSGVRVDLDQVETNFVQIDVGSDRAAAIERMKANGVLVSVTIHPTIVRAVTHLDVNDVDVERAIEAIPRALNVLARA